MESNVRYIILTLLILYTTINANTVNVFSANNIYYSSLNRIDEGFVLKNTIKISVINSDVAELFNGVINKNYKNISFTKDIKVIREDNGVRAILLPNIKSYIKIDDNEYQFSRDNKINSFTIEFYLNPYQIRMNSKVYSKISIYNDGTGSKYSGIRANIINGKLVWQFNNIFMYEGKYYNVNLSKGEYLKENEWRHHSISFDATTGKLVKYIDGLEEEVIYLTSTGDRTGSPYTINFDNITSVPTYLGQGFIGGIDSFNFIPIYKNKFELYQYEKSGELITKVLNFNNQNFFIDTIDYNGIIKDKTYIDVYYRASENYFSEENDNIEWVRLENKNNIINSKKIKYIQLKAVLETDNKRDKTPVLEAIKVGYHLPKKPLKPINIKATPLNGSIMLQWEGSHEDISGYKIYYGTESGIYNNANNEPIIVDDINEYIIDNLDNNEIYYFRVTTIGGEGGNIESDFSEEVYARPNY